MTRTITLDQLVADPSRVVADLPREAVTPLLADLRRAVTYLEARQQAMASGNEAAQDRGNGEPEASARITLNAQEVAERLGRPVSYVRYLCREGKIRASRDGREWLIRPESVREWLETHEHEPARSATPSPIPSRADPAPRLNAVPANRRRRLDKGQE